MFLRELLKDIDYELIQGSLDIKVDDLAYDSRKVDNDMAFVAIKGFRVDGHDYIDEAIEKGSKVINVERNVKIYKSITIIKLDDTRLGLAKISRTLFGYPDKELITIGITGTKGKTTTSWIVREILNGDNRDCGYIGTMGVFYGDKYYHTVNTTPESYDVYKYMRDMLESGVKYLVMEVSSQSLKLDRWKDIIFDYGVFTNLSLDHVGLDEHANYREYVYCKSKLFKQCKIGLFNIDDKEYETMTKDFKGKLYTFGKSGKANFRIRESHNVIESGFMGIEFITEGIIKDKFRVSIPGDFNSYNVICAISLCNLLGVEIDVIKKTLEHVSVRGRLEPVHISDKFNILIDYAYQGVAMENVLKTIKESNPIRIVNIFGCGGNRSRQRRFDCGEVSGKYADLSIITSDNSRYESVDNIIKDILVGINKTGGKYIVVPDRREAIKYSIVNAKEGDVILILGKGHEDYQEIEGVRYPFDERVVIREIVDNLTDEEKKNL